ncbi:hypothetical protein ACQ86B_21875 [Mycolicibacterium aichiense]|uniref:hypothetical protein n=1 Tax=Mycolicibacterium aichiense TaxID=1799 RepID=UPI003D673C7B
MALAGFGFAALFRRTLLMIIALLLLTVTIPIQVPRYHFPGLWPDSTTSVYCRTNLRTGEVDPSSFVTLANDRADAVTVSELTPEAIQRFYQAGLGAAFPTLF